MLFILKYLFIVFLYFRRYTVVHPFLLHPLQIHKDKLNRLKKIKKEKGMTAKMRKKQRLGLG